MQKTYQEILDLNKGDKRKADHMIKYHQDRNQLTEIPSNPGIFLMHRIKNEDLIYKSKEQESPIQRREMIAWAIAIAAILVNLIQWYLGAR